MKVVMLSEATRNNIGREISAAVEARGLLMEYANPEVRPVSASLAIASMGGLLVIPRPERITAKDLLEIVEVTRKMPAAAVPVVAIITDDSSLADTFERLFRRENKAEIDYFSDPFEFIHEYYPKTKAEEA